jgi:hypothetical protein
MPCNRELFTVTAHLHHALGTRMAGVVPAEAPLTSRAYAAHPQRPR